MLVTNDPTRCSIRRLPVQRTAYYRAGRPVNSLSEATVQAAQLVAGGDPRLVQIVLLSLRVSLTAVVIACLIGLPFGAAIAVSRFAGRRSVIVVLNALMGLPPVVVGLVVYLLLSRAGPLGSFGADA